MPLMVMLFAKLGRAQTANAEAAEQAESHKAQIASTENDLATIKAAIVENPEQMVREIGEFKVMRARCAMLRVCGADAARAGRD